MNFGSLPTLLFLGFSCYVILALSQVTGTCVYRLSEGGSLSVSFIRDVLDVSADIKANSVLHSFPSVYEEVMIRGVILTLFMDRGSEGRAIGVSALIFGFLHLLNILNPGASSFGVVCQVVWTSIIGVYYGYITVKTGSLVPSMIVHWFGNAFIYSFTHYINNNASIETYYLYFIFFILGVIPTSLMIFWTKYYSSRWMVNYE